jgi:hypothetical protein
MTYEEARQIADEAVDQIRDQRRYAYWPEYNQVEEFERVLTIAENALVRIAAGE